jgi:beta-catenin-like protein 1
MTMATATSTASSMDDTLDRIMGVTVVPSDEAVPFLPSKTWQGSKSGYYFGTSDQGTGYYLDTSSSEKPQATADGAVKKRKRITIDEGKNQVKAIPARMSAEELLEQAEQEHSDEKVLDVTPKGIQQALSGLTKLSRKNALQRAKYSNDPEQYMESELALHQMLQAFSAVATQPQLFAYVSASDLVLFGEILTHDNTDIATTMMHVLVEWLEDSDSEEGGNSEDNTTHIIHFAKRMVGGDEANDTSILDLMIANLGRLENDDDDDEYQQGVEDVLTCVEQLVELELVTNVLLLTKLSVAEYIAKETTLLSWLVAQLPKSHGRSAEILALLVQQPALHNQVKDWSKLPIYSSVLVDDEEDDDEPSDEKKAKIEKSTPLDSLEIMLQSIAGFRKRQPDSETETLFLENIVLTMASALTFASNGDNGRLSFISQFLEAQGPELIVRCVKEKVHAGGVGLALLDMRDKHACEQLVAMGALKYIFPIFMGRSIPKPAPSSTSGKKAKRAWLHKLEEHIIFIMYNLTRYLSDSSPDDAKQRLLVKFLDHDKLDRLVELLLSYDERARKAEFKFYRYSDGDDEEDDVLGALSAKLAGGGDLFHRIGAICAFVSVNSKRSHSHLMEQLTLQKSGIGLVKTAIQEFVSVLADEEQKAQLQQYLEQI